jgi:5-methylcytosine-specific restriction endonuclease McrA
MADRWETHKERRQAAAKAVFAHWGTVCHLCGKEGADTIDHLVPRSVIKELDLPMSLFDVDNLRPAHRACNSKRGKKAAPVRRLRAERAVGW